MEDSEELNTDMSALPLGKAKASPNIVLESEKLKARYKAEEIPFLQQVKDNALAPVVNAVSYLDRAFSSETEEYDPKKEVDKYTAGLSMKYRDMFLGVSAPKTHEQALELRNNIIRDEQIQMNAANAGFKGISGMLIGSVLNPIELPLMMLSGGVYAGAKTSKLLANTALAGTRKSGMLQGAAIGAEAGLISAGIEAVSRPIASAEDVPIAILTGMGIGGTLGGLTKYDYMTDSAIGRIKSEIVDVNPSKNHIPTTNNINYSTANLDSELSMGSSLAPDSTIKTVRDKLTDSNKEVFDKMRTVLIDNNVGEKLDDFTKDTAGKAVDYFTRGLNKIPQIENMYDRMTNWGTVGTALAYLTAESPVGRARNNASSAMLKQSYEHEILGSVMGGAKWRHAEDAWAKENGYSGTKRWTTQYTEVRNKFGRDLYLAIAHKRRYGTFPDGTSKAIEDIAPAYNEAYENARLIARGKDGEIPVYGFETLEADPWWQPQRWNADKMFNIINRSANPTATRKAIENALLNTYRKLYAGVDDAALSRIAKMLVTRQSAKAKSLDMDLRRMLESEGGAYLVEALESNGMSAKEANRLVNQLRGLDADKGKISSAKKRMEIDPSTRIEGTDLMLVDLLDTDPYRLPAMYARQISGTAALARNGIQRSDLPKIKDAIREEAAIKNGKWTDHDELLLEAIESYFDSAPIAGGVSPLTTALLRLTNLALLNQLGLTQLAETGIIIAANGVDSFLSSTKSLLKSVDGSTGFIADLKDIGLHIGQNQHLYDMEYSLDFVRQSDNGNRGLALFLDQALARGSRLQGFTSLFNKIMAKQQQLAIYSVMYKMNKVFKNGVKERDITRLADIGLEGDDLTRIQKYFTNGTVEFGDDINANFDKWQPRDVDTFKLAMHRYVDQMVQKSHFGEDNVWWDTNMGKILTHLKTFPLQAMTKTFARNMRWMDTETAGMFLYGLSTASLVVAAKATINGQQDKLDAEYVARSAFGLSNMTGWIPMWADPVMSMLGVEDNRINSYGARGITADIFGTPPVFSTLNRVAHIPFDAAPDLITGNYNNEDLYALRATPLLGNAYGFNYLFNEMKQ